MRNIFPIPIDMSKEKDEDDVLSSYTDLSEAIRFFLHESFRHIENEIRNHIASHLYGKKLKGIDTTDEDHKVVSGFEGKLDSPLELIRSDMNPLSENTLTKLAVARNEAQIEAELVI